MEPGDRLLLYSDGVIHEGKGQAGLGHDGVAAAALSSHAGSAADIVRTVHHAVLRVCGNELQDDATVVCLAVE